MNHFRKNRLIILYYRPAMKKNIRFVLLGLVLGIASFEAVAQMDRQTRRVKDNNDAAAYQSMLSGGITTNTNSGILGGVVVRHSQALSSNFMGKKQYRYMALELVNVRHSQEQSVQMGYGARFTRNKLNYLFALRPEYGREIVLFNRNDSEGIALSAIFAVGPTLGLQKPTMVRVQETRNRVVSVPYDPARHNSGNIVGTNFFGGFDKTKIVPGLHVKAALAFELNAFRNSVTGVEVGFLAEAFSKKPEIMASAENKSFYTSGFISLYFGKTK